MVSILAVSLGDRFCVSRRVGQGGSGGCTQRVKMCMGLAMGLGLEQAWITVMFICHFGWMIYCQKAIVLNFPFE